MAPVRILPPAEINARRLLLRLSGARAAIRQAQSKAAYLAAVTDEWDILQELDGHAQRLRERKEEEGR